jgi:thiamine-phosphate pyrophosphorylase
MKNKIDLSFYLVLDPKLCAPLGMIETARLAVAGGATAVQLRHKQADTRQMVEIGRVLQTALTGSGATLVINDDWAAARELNADALHIGQDDISPLEARKTIGSEMVLGLSVQSPELAKSVDAGLVDYIGAGPVFATKTKPDHKSAIGFNGLAKIVNVSAVPTVAIGGLKQQHIADIFASGAQGIAVVSAICGQPDLQIAIDNFHNKINEVRQ